MKTKCESLLKKLIDKEYILFTKRGNFSINASLKLAKHLGFKTVCTQDQGGWMTYSQFIKKNNLEEKRLKTNHGLLSMFDEKKSVVLLNSMPGYCALENMSYISAQCKKNDSFLINDVSGSIGTKEATFGDLIIGSFGRWKPINIGEGGFIATNNKEHYDFLKEFSFELDFEKLYENLINLEKRLSLFEKKNESIKKDLFDFKIVHPKHKGINVIVLFKDDVEKEKLIKYCKNNNYEFVICPMYIRVLDNAVSIEVKRLD